MVVVITIVATPARMNTRAMALSITACPTA